MEISKSGAQFIKSFEGCRLHAYQDTGGVWTIGYGATGPEIGRNTIWTQDQVEARFLEDLSSRAKTLSTLLGNAETTQGQFDAMLSLMYNIGNAAFKKSSVLREHKARRYSMAASSLLKWNKDNGVVIMGLVRRRIAEKLMYLGELK
jgi:GH24 family phage-related lysozyme (muramidase)